MTRRKNKRRSRQRKRPIFRLKPKLRRKLKRVSFGLQISAVLAIGLLLFINGPGKNPETNAQIVKAANPILPKPVLKPKAEPIVYYPTVEKKREPLTPIKKTGSSSPKIVFVIDDVGHNLFHEEALTSLGDDVTYAILPLLPHSRYFSSVAQQTGAEVILHLPLESANGTIPGPGLITSRMDESYIREMVDRDLASVPYHVGVNNHMGSMGTANPELMRTILEELKRRGLFVLDSQTTGQSVIPSLSNELNLPSLKRDVFLDNVDEREAIRMQVNQTRAIALRQGYAVAIGHYRDTTLGVLAEEIPKLKDEGFEILSLSELLKHKKS